MSSSKPDDVHCAPAPQLAGMIGADSPAGTDWTPGELAQILQAYLAAPAHRVGDEGDDAEGGQAASSSGPTRAELLGSLSPSPDELARICDCALAARRDREGGMPPEVATVLYYAAWSAAWTRGGHRIDGPDDRTLLQGLNWTARQGWAGEPSVGLAAEAARRLAAAGVQALETTPPGELPALPGLTDPERRALAHTIVLPPMSDAGGGIGHQTDEPPRGGTPGGSTEEPMDEVPGTLVGRYRLLELLGEGGFGRVFLADQEHPVRRQVAVKVLKAGMDTRDVVARFQAERQALAMMDHPNIAKVLDAGSTAAGRPYFVMEVVRGVPITGYCDEKKVTPRERVQLFAQVCRAVQHAHSKGIIHRDIKPSNVLVAEREDGTAVPTVIDFGIAKAIQQTPTEATAFTRVGHFLGTPHYMSPEQAGGPGGDVDTRSDIYSLGVLLYELLTGSTPFDAGELRSKSRDEVQRIIREVEPRRPSTRLTDLGPGLSEVAAHRGTEPRKLTRFVRGELDWIVMRCLEKEPARRYETASALAADMERYLAGETVAAGPPSRRYQMRKFVRRNRVGVASAAAAFLVLVLLGSLVGYGMLRDARQSEKYIQNLKAEQVTTLTQRNRAEEQRKQAEERRQEGDDAKADSDAVSRFLQDMLRAASPVQLVPGAPLNPTVRQVLDNAAVELDHGSLAGRPRVEATVRFTLASTYNELSRPEAEVEARKALELRRRILGNEHPEVAESLWQLATVLDQRKGACKEAEPLYRQAWEMNRKLLGEEHPTTVKTLIALAGFLKDKTEAESLLQQALALTRKISGTDDARVADCLDALAPILENHGAYPNAEALCRESLEMKQRLFGTESVAFVNELENVAKVLMERRKFTEAEVKSRQALAISRKLFGEDHPRVSEYLNNLAVSVESQGKLDEAAALYRESLAIDRKADRDDLTWKTLESLGGISGRLGRWPEAEDELRQGLSIQLKVQGEGNPELVTGMRRLAEALMNRGKFDEAESILRQALEVGRKASADDDQKVVAARHLLGSLLYESMGDGAGAAAVSLEGLRAELPRIERMLQANPTDPRLYASRGKSLERMGRFEEAVAAYARAVELAGGSADYLWFYQLARLRLYLGDEEGYRNECRHMLELLGQTNQPDVAEKFAKTCLLTVRPEGDTSELRRLLVQALNSANSGLLPYVQFSRAILEYRVGNYAQAIDWLDRCKGRLVPIVTATWVLLEDMANYRLGHGPERIAASDAAVANARAGLPEAGVGDLAIGGGPEDWLVFGILYREREALIHPGAKGGSGKSPAAAASATAPVGSGLPQTRPSPARTIEGWGQLVDSDGDCTVQEKGDGLAITVPGTPHDMTPEQQNAPRVVREVDGDFTLQVRVTGDLDPGDAPSVFDRWAFNGAGLVVIANGQQIRLERGLSRSPEGLTIYAAPSLAYYKNGVLKRGCPATTSRPFYKQSTWLRLERSGSVITPALSHDGVEWITVDPFNAALPAKVQLGIMAINTSKKPFVARFEELKLSAGVGEDGGKKEKGQ